MSRTTIHYCRGFYINCQGNLVGVVATPGGPAFFYNLDIYFLRERPFRFTLESDQFNNTVHFSQDGRQKMQITYMREISLQEGDWADDELHDFFHWLIKAVNNRKFYGFYTLNKGQPLACSLADRDGREGASMSTAEYNSQDSVDLDDAIRRADEILDNLDEATN